MTAATSEDGAPRSNVRSTRVVPLPSDATAEQIVELCATTADLVAFRAALRWLEADDWDEARSRLERALLDEQTTVDPDSYASQRAARGRLAARFHKVQLLRAEDGLRRNGAATLRRRAAAVALEVAD
jgi:hypothetical protein